MTIHDGLKEYDTTVGHKPRGLLEYDGNLPSKVVNFYVCQECEAMYSRIRTCRRVDLPHYSMPTLWAYVTCPRCRKETAHFLRYVRVI